MSITDEMHHLLDERGVFWVDIPLVNMKRTCWKSCDEQDGYCYFEESDFGVTKLTISNLTPEQAIAATLGLCSPDGAVADLRKENKTLRKLVDGWDFCSKTKNPTFDECVGCPLFEQSPHGYRCTRSELMRKVGVVE